jgi:hypothetical protein
LKYDLAIIVPTISLSEDLHDTIANLKRSIIESTCELKIQVIISDNSQTDNHHISFESSDIFDVVVVRHETRLESYKNFLSGLILSEAAWTTFLAIDDALEVSFFDSLSGEIQTAKNLRAKVIMPQVKVDCTKGHRIIAFDAYMDSSYFYDAPIGWFIYSVVDTRLFQKVFSSSLICDWTDYNISLKLINIGFHGSRIMTRIYDVPGGDYKIKAQGDYLNPIPIIIVIARSWIFSWKNIKRVRFSYWILLNLIRAIKFNVRVCLYKCLR